MNFGAERPGDPRAGLTLIELIIAVFVIVVALLGLFSVIDSSHRLDRNAQELRLASSAARHLLDDMRAMAEEDWDAVGTTSFAPEVDGVGTPLSPCVPLANEWHDVYGLQAPSAGRLPKAAGGGYNPPPRAPSEYNLGIIGACVEDYAPTI